MDATARSRALGLRVNRAGRMPLKASTDACTTPGGRPNVAIGVPQVDVCSRRSRTVNGAPASARPRAIARTGYFNPAAVQKLVQKCKAGGALGFKDNMALVGVNTPAELNRSFLEALPPRR